LIEADINIMDKLRIWLIAPEKQVSNFNFHFKMDLLSVKTEL